VGGFTSYHNGNKEHIFVIKIGKFSGQKQSHFLSENHNLNFLKEDAFRNRKSFQKNFRNLFIPKGWSFIMI